MPIGFLSPNKKFGFPRYVPAGIAFYGNNLSLLASDSSHVLVQINSTTITFDFIYFPEFYAPSSNYYSLDHTFNFEASQAYIGALPATSGVFCVWGYVAGEIRPRIIITVTSMTSPPILIPLPVYNSVWWKPP